MNAVKGIILWLVLALACFLPASALTPSALENRIRGISSIEYDITTEWDDISLEHDVLHATPDHRFWVNSKQAWLPASDLKPGMTVLRENGRDEKVLAIAIRHLSSPATTYNFNVQNEHDYFVGSTQILVHNDCSVTEFENFAGDVTANSQEEALEIALKRYGAVSDPDLIETENVYGINPNLLGPNGEPSEIVHALDKDGNDITIINHSNGHTFDDVEPPVVAPPHYHGPDGEHIYYPSK